MQPQCQSFVSKLINRHTGKVVHLTLEKNADYIVLVFWRGREELKNRMERKNEKENVQWTQ